MDASAFPCTTTIRATADDPALELRTTYLRATDDGATVWAWSAALQRAYPAVEGATVEGAHPNWDVLDADGVVLATVAYVAGDCACGHPMKGWQPPGASRVSVLEPTPVGASWGGPATSGFPPVA